ncbi:uncharacterized protein HMPREF1541_10828 [Cyphellophora europaea CBS 101466]|uniref:ATP-grasp domain-containing protein n=1 Tax=Cyphellophora europaea (strain CBS 101466) TaxID=1220924 RepID=W2S7F1_CYPE1|nr:uncharacterized protein HMPREF1541_10828 [Cyphellophora europaea CBS 101466]ETN43963.1 hypothetical protein HMPREF1541_10828 [Cyphellophora europaea CBS 101466]
MVSSEAIKNASLIILSLLFLPLDSFIATCSYLLGWVSKPKAIRPGHQKRNVLVTGVGMSKGLFLARAFYLAGHRVIGADFEPDGALSIGRTSKSLSRFYHLRAPAGQDASTTYVQDLLRIVLAEKIDLWVSCSGVASAVEDGQAKEIIEARTPCKALQFDIETTQMLHEKHTFVEHVSKCGLTVPETYAITTRADVERILRRAPSGRHYIMKTIGVVDAVRGDMTLLPKDTHDETLKHLQHLPISEECPWILQQFVQGAEFCTHSVVVNGRVKAFVACPSAELLMHYQMLPPDSALSLAMLAFTESIAARGGEGFTGHLSFDFMVEDADLKSNNPTLYPIECNPRAHTAVVLFNGTHRMVDAYMSLLGNAEAEEVIFPAQTGGYKYYWVGHDLATKLLLSTVGLCTLSKGVSAVLSDYIALVSHLTLWRDGTFELWDPWPWWCLYHIYWPVRFWHCIRTGTGWSRVNVSTTKMFEK